MRIKKDEKRVKDVLSKARKEVKKGQGLVKGNGGGGGDMKED